jgi:hypothetical protein
MYNNISSNILMWKMLQHMMKIPKNIPSNKSWWKNLILRTMMGKIVIP